MSVRKAGEQAGKIGDKIGGFFSKIGEHLKTVDLNSLVSLFTTGSVGMLVVAIANFFNKVSSGLDSIKEIPTKIVGLLDGFVGVLSAWQMKISADTLITVAKAIGILALSLVLLGLVEPEYLESATAALVSVLAMVAIIMAIYGKMRAIKTDDKATILDKFLVGIQDACKKAIKIAGMGFAMAGFAVAVGILILALGALAKIPMHILIWNVAKLLIVMGTLVAAFLLMTKLKIDEKFAKFGAAFLGLSVAVLVLAAAVKLMSTIDLGSLIAATIAISAILFMLSVLAVAASTIDNGWNLVGFAVAVIAIAGALTLLTIPLLVLSMIPFLSLLKAAGALIAITAAMVFFAAVLSEGKISVKPLLELAGALVIFGAALIILGLLAFPAIKGLSVLALALVALAAAAILLTGFAPMLSELAATLWTMSISALNFAIAGIALAAALWVLGAALPTLADGLVALGERLRTNGLEIVLAVTAILLTIIAAFAAASVIQAIQSSFTKWINAGCTTIQKTTPTILRTIGVVLVAILMFLEAFAPTLADRILSFIATLINSIAEGIKTHGTAILLAVWNLFTSIFIAIRDFLRGALGSWWAPIEGMINACVWLVKAAVYVVSGFITVIVEVVAAIVTAVAWLFGLISEGIHKIMDPVFEWLSEKFGWVGEGIGWIKDGVEKLFGKATEDTEKAAEAMGDTAEKSLAEKGAEIKATTQEMVDDNTQVDTSKVEENAKEPANAYGGSFMDTLKDFSGDPQMANIMSNFTSNEQITGMFETGGSANGLTFIENLTGQYKESTPEVTQASGEVATTAAEDSAPQYKAGGIKVAAEYIGGLVSKLLSKESQNKVADASRKTSRFVVQGGEEGINAHSPSREAMKLGGYWIDGLAIGIESKADIASDAAYKASRSLIDALAETSEEINSYFEDGVNTNPVISPIVDLENLQNGVRDINGLFGSRSIAMSGTVTNINSSRDSLMRQMDEMFNARFSAVLNPSGEIEANPEYTFNLVTEIDGRQVAKSTATYTRDELRRLDKNANRKVGLV